MQYQKRDLSTINVQMWITFLQKIATMMQNFVTKLQFL